MTKQDPDKNWPNNFLKHPEDFPFGPIPHWVNPSDKLPEIDQEVLTWCENKYSGPYATYSLGQKYMALDKYLKYGFRTEALGYGKVLRWMQLPEPPEMLNA